MNFKLLPYLLLFPIFSTNSLAMQPLSEEGLDAVTGQDGVSLSGELSFNEDGGPLTSSDPGNIDPNDASVVWGTCTEKDALTADKCGARLAVKPNGTDGWLALDELKGSVSFEAKLYKGGGLSIKW